MNILKNSDMMIQAMVEMDRELVLKRYAAVRTEMFTLNGVTGAYLVDARHKEIESFVDQYETALAHRQYLVQYSFCDFQTLSGRPQTISINLLNVGV